MEYLLAFAIVYFSWKSGAHAFAIVLGMCLLAIIAPAASLALPTFVFTQIASPIGQSVLTLFFVILGFAVMFGAAGKVFNGK